MIATPYYRKKCIQKHKHGVPQHLKNSMIVKTDNQKLAFNNIFSGLFAKNNKVVITPELESKFMQFQQMFNSTSMTAEAVANQIRGVDQSIIDCAKSTENGALTWDMYKASLNHMTMSAKIGQLALKGVSIAANIAIMWAFSAIISLVTWLWDQFNVTVKEVQANVDGLTANIANLNTELDELNSKNTLTDAEQNRLKYLESRIDLEERLLKIEQTRLAQEQLGDPSKITDWFDDDSYVKKASLEFGEDAVKRPMSFLGVLFPEVNNLMNLIHSLFIFSYHIIF